MSDNLLIMEIQKRITQAETTSQEYKKQLKNLGI